MTDYLSGKQKRRKRGLGVTPQVSGSKMLQSRSLSREWPSVSRNLSRIIAHYLDSARDSAAFCRLSDW